MNGLKRDVSGQVLSSGEAAEVCTDDGCIRHGDGTRWCPVYRHARKVEDERFQ